MSTKRRGAATYVIRDPGTDREGAAACSPVITYGVLQGGSPLNHAKRHYDLAGIAAYWSTRARKELKKALTRQRGIDL